jgi:hypothetical protein
MAGDLTALPGPCDDQPLVIEQASLEIAGVS